MHEGGVMVEAERRFEIEEALLRMDCNIKAEYLTNEDKRKILSFIAKSSHRFYLEVAEKINSKP
ncbi:MAG: hypothetical protein ACLTQL_05620 [Eisenbergiella sp.]